MRRPASGLPTGSCLSTHHTTSQNYGSGTSSADSWHALHAASPVLMPAYRYCACPVLPAAAKTNKIYKFSDSHFSPLPPNFCAKDHTWGTLKFWTWWRHMCLTHMWTNKLTENRNHLYLYLIAWDLSYATEQQQQNLFKSRWQLPNGFLVCIFLGRRLQLPTCISLSSTTPDNWNIHSDIWRHLCTLSRSHRQ